MTGSILQQLRESLPATAEELGSCRDNNCLADTRTLDAIIIKGESVAANGEKAADCIIFFVHGGRIYVAIIELKSKTYHASSIVEKVRNSERFARALLLAAGVNAASVIRAVFAKGGHPAVTAPEYVLLVKRGGITLRRCGQSVAELVA